MQITNACVFLVSGLISVFYVNINLIDAMIFAVKHEEYKNIKLDYVKKIFDNSKPVIIDVKRLFDRKDAENMGFVYWGL